MKLGIIIHSNDAETVWNAFRLANFALNSEDTVKVFLLAKGVECESANTEQFNVTEQMTVFADKGGEILACGTCLQLRQAKGTDLCPVSSMSDLYGLVRDSDRVLTF